MKSTILIRINPNTDGSFSVVLTNHNVPGADNRAQVSRKNFPAVQTAVADFLVDVANTEAEQVAAEKAQAKKDAAAAK